VTVRAHEDTLFRFLTQLGQRFSGGHAEGERFGARIHVVEVEVDHAAVVSAHGAAAACLGHENPLHLLETARDSLAYAALASPASSSLPGAVAMKDH
jgi:hypothetical protein